MSCPTLSTIIDFIHRTLGPDTNDTDATPLSPYLIPVSLKFKTIPERPTKKHTATVIFLHVRIVCTLYIGFGMISDLFVTGVGRQQ